MKALKPATTYSIYQSLAISGNCGPVMDTISWDKIGVRPNDSALLFDPMFLWRQRAGRPVNLGPWYAATDGPVKGVARIVSTRCGLLLSLNYSGTGMMPSNYSLAQPQPNAKHYQRYPQIIKAPGSFKRSGLILASALAHKSVLSYSVHSHTSCR